MDGVAPSSDAFPGHHPQSTIPNPL
jgi:hypothetical protein